MADTANKPSLVYISMLEGAWHNFYFDSHPLQFDEHGYTCNLYLLVSNYAIIFFGNSVTSS